MEIIVISEKQFRRVEERVKIKSFGSMSRKKLQLVLDAGAQVQFDSEELARFTSFGFTLNPKAQQFNQKFVPGDVVVYLSTKELEQDKLPIAFTTFEIGGHVERQVPIGVLHYLATSQPYWPIVERYFGYLNMAENDEVRQALGVLEQLMVLSEAERIYGLEIVGEKYRFVYKGAWVTMTQEDIRTTFGEMSSVMSA